MKTKFNSEDDLPLEKAIKISYVFNDEDQLM